MASYDPECSLTVTYRNDPKSLKTSLFAIRTTHPGFFKSATFFFNTFGEERVFTLQPRYVYDNLSFSLSRYKRTTFLNTDPSSPFPQKIDFFAGDIIIFPALDGIFFLQIENLFYEFRPENLLPGN
jgi:hypothetical protein